MEEERIIMLKRVWSTVACALLFAAGALAPAPPAQAAPTIDERLDEAEETIRELQKEVEELRKAKSEAKPAAEDPSTFRVFWKDGLRAETKDKKFTTKIGGRIHNDWTAGTLSQDLQDKVGDFKNGVEFRRARLYMQGTMNEHFDYKVQFDFAGGDADFKDVYMGYTGIPYVVNVRVGQFKEPFSLEELTSSNQITFLERALPNDAFVPARNTGIMLYNALLDQRMTVAGGYFHDTDDFGDETSDHEQVFTGRVTGLPVYEDDGRVLVHLGAAGRWRKPGSESARFRSRPEIHNSQRFIDTGEFAANNLTSSGAEFATVYGPASLQAEYIYQSVDTPGSADPAFDGFYVFGSYFLTGEHRPYKPAEAVFEPVRPTRNFSIKDGTWGAWEVAARYSQADLDDAGIKGGELRNTTVGLNWYLNYNYRIMYNWVHTDRKSEGDGDLFGVRFQVFF
jgi:phosphate-selective porin OprO/OprP